MKKRWSKNKMHELVNSGLSTFDKQVSCLSCDGNVLATTQVAGYIRPYTEIECNGVTYPEGYLQRFDLSSWRASSACREFITAVENRNKNYWWTQFFYHTTSGKRITLMEMVVTDNKITFITYPEYQRVTSKQLACRKFLISYITMGLWEKRKETLEKCCCFQLDPNCEWSEEGSVYRYEVNDTDGKITIYSNEEYPTMFICSLEHFIRYYQKPSFTGNI